MARAFAKIAFTPQVQAAQQRMGSRSAYRNAELGEVEVVELGAFEEAFITERDSFYLGTVGENGWPYVQHRGGPAGFLRVLGPNLIGFADYAGNRQYISVGNLAGDDRVSLFLMDYPGQRRLKIWGRARIIDADNEPALLSQLDSPHYRARVERGMVITIEAFDWNCPKHITPRFTEAEVRAQLESLAIGTAPHHGARDEAPVLGNGPLQVEITGIRQLTPRVRAYTLRAADGGDLPAFEAGAHLVVPVRLPDGSTATRQYSIASDPAIRDHYELAVLREEDGRGGSAAIHAQWQLGTRLALDPPANQFPLHGSAPFSLLIAGGIGITPIKAMAHALKSAGRPFALHYAGRTQRELAYREELLREFAGPTHLHVSRGDHPQRMDLRAIMASAPDQSVFHVCGPDSLIQAALESARQLGLPAERVQFESFD